MDADGSWSDACAVSGRKDMCCVLPCSSIYFYIIQMKLETLHFGGRDLKKTQNFGVRAYSPVHIFEVTVQVCSDRVEEKEPGNVDSRQSNPIQI